MAFSRGARGDGRGQGHPVCGTYGSKVEFAPGTWAKWLPSRLLSCFWRQVIWQCPQQQTDPHCHCCWLEGQDGSDEEMDSSQAKMSLWLSPLFDNMMPTISMQA